MTRGWVRDEESRESSLTQGWIRDEGAEPECILALAATLSMRAAPVAQNLENLASLTV